MTPPVVVGLFVLVGALLAEAYLRAKDASNVWAVLASFVTVGVGFIAIGLLLAVILGVALLP